MRRDCINLVWIVLFTSASAQVARLQGRITVSGTEDPVTDAKIVVHGTRYSASSDASGHYLISDIPAGTYRISCHHKQYLGAQENWVVVEGERRVDIDLRSPEADHARVWGEITCDTVPCADVIVRALRYGSVRALAISAADGGYVMSGLAKGDYQIHAMAFGHLPGSAEDVSVTVESETEPQTFERNIQLSSAGGFSVRARVGLRDNPLDKSGTVITINGQVPALSTQTDKGGNAILIEVPAGPLSFTASRDGYHPATRLDVVVAGDIEVGFVLNELPDPNDPRFSVSGRVDLHDNPAVDDLEGSRVSLWSPSGLARYTTYTNSQGRYAFSGIRATDGPFQAGAARDGFLPQVVEAFSLEADISIDFQLSLDPEYKPPDQTDFGCGHHIYFQSTDFSVWFVFFITIAMRIRKWNRSKKACSPK